MKGRTAFVVVSLSLLAPVHAQEKITAPQNASIRKEDMKPDLVFLALDLTRGRLTGTSENRIAAEFIKARCAAATTGRSCSAGSLPSGL